MKDLEIVLSLEVKWSCDSAVEILDLAFLRRLPSRVMGLVSCLSPWPSTLHPASYMEVHRLLHTIPSTPAVCSDLTTLNLDSNVCLLSLFLP